jgi:hypothetical protein
VYTEAFRGMFLLFFHTGVIQHLHYLKTKRTLTDFLTNVSKYTLKLRDWKYIILVCIITIWYFIGTSFRCDEYLAYPHAHTCTRIWVTENCHLEAWGTLWCVVEIYRSFGGNYILHIWDKEGSVFFRSVEKLLLGCMASHPKRWHTL